MTTTELATEIEAAAAALPVRNSQTLRALRREYSKRIKNASPAEVLKLAAKLLAGRRVHRFFADELIASRPDVLQSLDRSLVERLGAELSSWDEVDSFACYLSGPAWREGRLEDEAIREWARSPDRWWRRAALVSTVPLNVKARGGHGDTERTLGICSLLVDDRDDMVVKALSWALRALVTNDAKAVRAFLQTNERRLALRVRREVAQKLTTGVKKKRKAVGATEPS